MSDPICNLGWQEEKFVSPRLTGHDDMHHVDVIRDGREQPPRMGWPILIAPPLSTVLCFVFLLGQKTTSEIYHRDSQ